MKKGMVISMEKKSENGEKEALRKRKKCMIILLVFLFLAAATGLFVYLNRQEEGAEAESALDITAGENQELLLGEITLIRGNDMTFDVVQEEESGEESDDVPTRENRKTYRVTGESREMTIPVGTDVITKLGTTTTFARLTAGDVVQILLETGEEGESVIVKMWILQ